MRYNSYEHDKKCGYCDHFVVIFLSFNFLISHFIRSGQWMILFNWDHPLFIYIRLDMSHQKNHHKSQLTMMILAGVTVNFDRILLWTHDAMLIASVRVKCKISTEPIWTLTNQNKRRCAIVLRIHDEIILYICRLSRVYCLYVCVFSVCWYIDG